jgi:FtsH-binding integral membrane protein
MEQGWDPEVKKYFRKILNSFGYGLLWMISCATAGIYFQLGYFSRRPVWQPILFYFLMLCSLGFFLRYMYKTWKDG